MSNHPNPTADAIRAARESAQLSQTDAAVLIHASLGAWQKWEQGDRRMHPAFWELFRLKSGAGKAAQTT